jgi:hypothetical protein
MPDLQDFVSLSSHKEDDNWKHSQLIKSLYKYQIFKGFKGSVLFVSSKSNSQHLIHN